jgi:short-subunit dehydrogenase
MRPALKRLHEQVIVITGATSGIGLVTARMAAARGACVVLVSRNEHALKQLTAELTGRGSNVVFVVADVGDEQQVRRIADVAIERFGGIDTWVNNAGVSIFGRLEDVPLADQRRLFDTNFWGVVHGSQVAVEHLRHRGGALINLGSEVSDVALPLQGIYSASKHAVKGLTDTLRIEIEQAGLPISVTLIKPAAIDTLFVPHARNYMEVQPRLPAPLYAPELAARAVLYAAEHPKRDIYVGGAARLGAVGAQLAPRLSDWILRKLMFRLQRTDRRAGDHEGALYRPGAIALQERQGTGRVVFENSLYTQAVLHPRTSALVGTALFAMAALWLMRSGRRPV